MELRKLYSFRELEIFLQNWDNRDKCLKVADDNCTALMHTFKGNFCGDWKDGDGILFYSDGEIHSSEPDTEFFLLEIIEF